MPDVYPVRKKRDYAKYVRFVRMIGVGAVILIPFIVILNYFRFISLPLLPQRVFLDKQELAKTIYNAQRPLYVCPLEAKLCITGKTLYDTSSNSLNGFGYEALPKDTQILAIFDGEYKASSQSEAGLTRTTVTLTDSKKQTFVVYTFIGSLISDKTEGQIGQGGALGIASGERGQLLEFTPALYSLHVAVNNLVTKQKMNLKPSSDGKTLGL